MDPYRHQFTNPSADRMPRSSTGTHVVENNWEKATMKLSALYLWRSNARVAIAQERKFQQKLKVYGHNIAQSTSAMNVVEKVTQS